jgi:hypothetical protein
VGGDEGVGALVERTAPEVRDVGVSSAAMVETCDLDNLLIPSDSTSFSIRRVETPSR